MKKKVALFVSDDFFSKYAYKKLIQNYEVYPFSLKKIKNFETFVLKNTNFNLLYEFLKKNNIKFILWVGKVNPDIIFKTHNPIIKNLISDLNGLKPERIMKKISDFFEKNGIKVLPETMIFKEEIAEKKIYTFPLTEEEKKDVKIGFSVLKNILKYNIGQAVAVKKGMILGIEGIEGTDNFIKRIGKYCKNFVFVKGCGKDKDLRFDIPVIGLKTVKNLVKAGGKVIAIEAEKTIILQKEKVINECMKNKIKLIGIK